MTQPEEAALADQAIAAADGIELLQDSRHLRRRTAEILRELVAALYSADGMREGLERAARYHDDAVRDCESIAAVNRDNKLGADCTTHAIDHRIAADDLRALIATPQQFTGPTGEKTGAYGASKGADDGMPLVVRCPVCKGWFQPGTVGAVVGSPQVPSGDRASTNELITRIGANL